MKHCLIVDDSRVIRRVATKIVQDFGFEAEEAENGKTALDTCQARLPDIVLVDLDMPVMDGVTYLRALRRLPGGEKVTAIACTSDSGTQQMQQAIDAGADEYIMKPYDSEILHSKFLLLELL